MSDRKLWSLGFVFSPELDHVVLLKKARSLHIGLWNGVGGGLENKETYESSMVRECVEESGLQTEKIDWKRAAKLTGVNWSVGVFAFRIQDKKIQHIEHADLSKVDLIPPDKAVYVPMSAISTLNLAPYTAALIHLCLEKLKNPNFVPVVVQTYTY